jgi:hypothetical protein
VSEAASERFGRGLVALTLLAFGARAAFILLEPAAEPTGDEPSWIALGMGLARARVGFSPLKADFVFYPPAYPYFLGAVATAFGGLAAVKWAQAVVGALLVPAVGRVGRLAFTPRAGLIAAALVALYPDLVWFGDALPDAALVGPRSHSGRRRPASGLEGVRSAGERQWRPCGVACELLGNGRRRRGRLLRPRRAHARDTALLRPARRAVARAPPPARLGARQGGGIPARPARLRGALDPA